MILDERPDSQGAGENSARLQAAGRATGLRPTPGLPSACSGSRRGEEEVSRPLLCSPGIGGSGSGPPVSQKLKFPLRSCGPPRFGTCAQPRPSSPEAVCPLDCTGAGVHLMPLWQGRLEPLGHPKWGIKKR
ncbi:hypothetical protein TREES_T100016028 [Tupaia chinensis]|uniref:Uncharacterized protein n=1 Tax=Tupaia chinensis TaxID=246437 RepID=L9KKY2_TUPCH|nr:hypothetical protein TREES_T100016028 [Tupaia chinensis]